MENNNQNSNTEKPMTAEEIESIALKLYTPPLNKFGEKRVILPNQTRPFGFRKWLNAFKVGLLYAVQQTAELRKQLADKEAEIERLKSQKGAGKSKTFPGIAKAMAEQWGDYLIQNL